MLTLRELQAAFAAHLRGESGESAAFAVDDGIAAPERLAVYRNNARSFFERALRSTYPVIERRVGGDYFRQLCANYRAAHASPSGDLHWVGREFAPFLAEHLADSPYAWLSELAALEWAVASAAVAGDSDRVELAALSAIDAERLSALHFRFVPSLQTLSATVPVLTVWRANRLEAAGDAVDLTTGGECIVVHRAPNDDVELRLVNSPELQFVRALHRGRSLSEAIEDSTLPIEALPQVLRWMFTDGCVAAIGD